MNKDDDFGEFEMLWQSVGSPRDPQHDMAVTRKRLLRERMIFFVEVIIALAGLSAGIWFWLTLDTLTGVCAMLFSALGLVGSIVVRRNNIRLVTESVTDQLVLRERQLAANLTHQLWRVAIVLGALVYLGILSKGAVLKFDWITLILILMLLYVGYTLRRVILVKRALTDARRQVERWNNPAE